MFGIDSRRLTREGSATRPALVKWRVRAYSMTSTRREILSLIKRNGPMTVQELSRRLEITPMGVRQHLAILERDGVIASDGIRRGQGRRSRLYDISSEAHNAVPR